MINHNDIDKILHEEIIQNSLYSSEEITEVVMRFVAGLKREGAFAVFTCAKEIAAARRREFEMCDRDRIDVVATFDAVLKPLVQSLRETGFRMHSMPGMKQ